MADATMAEIVTTVTALLRDSLDCPVEEYWRVEPPTVLTVYVQPLRDGAASGVHMGNDVLDPEDFKRHSLSVIIEVPWADGVAGYQAVDAVRETIRQMVLANRDLTITDKDSPADGQDDGCTYQYAQRKGSGAPDNWAPFVTVSWRV